jgi:phage terminase large subunit
MMSSQCQQVFRDVAPRTGAWIETPAVPPVPRVEIPAAFAPLFQPSRYKIFYGGRDAAKSWSFAKSLLILAANRSLRILCTREYQSSIAESVYKVLVDQITKLNLEAYYDVQRTIIRSKCGSEFIFKGLKMNIMEIKSTEGIDICWVEEAQMMSDESWQVLIPTIRKPDSEIWMSFNTGQADDPTYKRFVTSPPPDSIVRKVNYYDNPFHSEVMEKERCYLLRVDPEAYEHVWIGKPLAISDACIFRNKFCTELFESIEGEQLFFGADWGFSNDPTALVRSFIRDNKLFIEHEAYGVGVELDEIPDLFDSVPGSRDWPIMADNSRPETISYVKKKASEFSRPINGQGVSKTGSRFCASLKKLSYTRDANTRSKNLNPIAGKKIAKAGTCYPLSLMPITTRSMQFAMEFPIIYEPDYTPVSKIVSHERN